MSFQIITDSAANLPQDIVLENDITVIPFTYSMNGSETEAVPQADEEIGEYYNKIVNGAKVTTSQITPGRYTDCFTKFLSQGKDLLYIGLSSGVSGAYNASCVAIRDLREKFPDRHIFSVDSLGASLGEGILALKAIDLRREGKSIADVFAFLNEYRRRIMQIFTVDNLKYLVTSGRISHVTALAGTVLNIKPILKGSPEGTIVQTAKVRGRKQAIDALFEKYKNYAVKPETSTVCISHANCLEDAKKLIEKICAFKKPHRLITVMHDPTTGSHIGPGSLALYFEGDENVRNH